MVYSKALLVLVIFICASSIACGLAENNDSNLAENNKDEENTKELLQQLEDYLEQNEEYERDARLDRYFGNSYEERDERALPRMGRAMPRMGRAMPRMGRAMPRMGRAMPRMGRSEGSEDSTKLKRKFPRIG